MCVCKVKNNLQPSCLEFITILTDTTSGGGGRGRWAALSRSGHFVIPLQSDADMFKCRRLTLLYIIVPDDAGGRRRDCASASLSWMNCDVTDEMLKLCFCKKPGVMCKNTKGLTHSLLPDLWINLHISDLFSGSIKSGAVLIGGREKESPNRSWRTGR